MCALERFVGIKESRKVLWCHKSTDTPTNYHYPLCTRKLLCEQIRCLIVILFITQWKRINGIFGANCARAVWCYMVMWCIEIYTQRVSVVISLVRAGEYFFFMFALSKPIHTLGPHSQIIRSELRSSRKFLLFTHNNCERAKKNTETHTHTITCMPARSLASRILSHSFTHSILSKWTYNLNGKQADSQPASHTDG